MEREWRFDFPYNNNYYYFSGLPMMISMQVMYRTVLSLWERQRHNCIMKEVGHRGRSLGASLNHCSITQSHQEMPESRQSLEKQVLA